ncbi:hypothetical protein LJC10_06435, partial [Selenomonadales bacterium OttesenSCG-928-I06]|nr:hypothetical protein [Selenomonadales bacterium OttesenSCG-928-I06]
NTQFGIYGKITTNALPVNEKYSEGLPVASMSQVKLGKAYILTVVEEQKIEEFEIEIEKINLQAKPEGKGLVIKVTDERLIEKTGGIVQGMSGSPIIQDGKIIGAVTHVFVHEPTLGYGCFMDWMLIESGLVKPNENQANNLFSFNIKKPDKTGFSAFYNCFYYIHLSIGQQTFLKVGLKPTGRLPKATPISS